MRFHWLLLLCLPLAACDEALDLPTPDGPSAEAIISYPSGFVDTLDPTSIQIHLSEQILAPGDTVRCLRGQVDGPPPPPPAEGADFIVDLVSVSACGPNFTRIPLSWGAVWDSATTAIRSEVRANTIGYYPDSGSVSVKRLGGGYAEMKFTLRYSTPGVSGFRINGQIIAPETPEIGW